MPFGVGQFSNGHPVRGALFATAEVGLFAAAAISFLAFESLEAPDGTFAASEVDRAEPPQATYLATFWTGVAVTALGIVEALIGHPGTWAAAPARDARAPTPRGAIDER